MVGPYRDQQRSNASGPIPIVDITETACVGNIKPQLAFWCHRAEKCCLKGPWLQYTNTVVRQPAQLCVSVLCDMRLGKSNLPHPHLDTFWRYSIWDFMSKKPILCQVSRDGEIAWNFIYPRPVIDSLPISDQKRAYSSALYDSLAGNAVVESRYALATRRHGC